MKKRTLNPIEEMRNLLGTSKKMMLENFIMPEEEVDMEQEVENNEVPEFQPTENVGIKDELTQIRKIVINAINKLADQPTSDEYNTMKRIWNLVDKAFEQPKTVDEI